MKKLTTPPPPAKRRPGRAPRPPKQKTTLHGLLRPLVAKPVRVADPPRFAMWSSGELEIRRDGEDIVLLTAAETQKLLSYLDNVLLAGDGGLVKR